MANSSSIVKVVGVRFLYVIGKVYIIFVNENICSN